MAISIHSINVGINRVYAIRGDSVILIDGGDLNKLDKIKAGLENAGVKPQEIDLIVLTHGHWDHIGTTKDIKDLTGAKVIMHRKDMHMLDDHTAPLQGFTTWGKLIVNLMKPFSPLFKFPSFEVDIVMDGNEFSLLEYGITGKLIHTPGHTWGSVSLLLDSGEAFVGDLAMNLVPLRIGPGLPLFGDDLQVVKESWRKLLDAGAKTVYPAHGKPFPAEVMRKAIAV